MSVKELCVCEKVVCEKVVCKRVVCKKVALKDLCVCVRKPACFFSRWVKVGLPSDTVEGRAGRSAITRMRTDWPVPLCVPSKVHLAHRPCCYIWFRTQHRSQARNMPRCLVQEHAARHETDRNVFKKQSTADTCTAAWNQPMPVLLPTLGQSHHR